MTRESSGGPRLGTVMGGCHWGRAGRGSAQGPAVGPGRRRRATWEEGAGDHETQDVRRGPQTQQHWPEGSRHAEASAGHAGGRVLTILQGRTGRHTQGLASPRAKFPGTQRAVCQGAFQATAERCPPPPPPLPFLPSPLPPQAAGRRGAWPRGALRAAASAGHPLRQAQPFS